MLQNFSNKVIVITGAGRGLGAAFALTLAKTNCQLILCARQISDLQAIAERVVKSGGKRPMLLALDLSQVSSIQLAVSQITATQTKIDILINNGATWLEASPEPYDTTDVMNVINTAVTGTFLLVQALGPLMQVSDTPDVLTIGSISGLPNAALQTVSVPFYAAKHGQVALAQGLRQEYAGSKFRSLLINPPYLEDYQPDQAEWHSLTDRQKGAQATNRDVIEAALFALTRARHISLTIDLDSDSGGMFGLTQVSALDTAKPDKTAGTTA